MRKVLNGIAFAWEGDLCWFRDQDILIDKAELEASGAEDPTSIVYTHESGFYLTAIEAQYLLECWGRDVHQVQHKEQAPMGMAARCFHPDKIPKSIDAQLADDRKPWTIVFAARPPDVKTGAIPIEPDPSGKVDVEYNNVPVIVPARSATPAIGTLQSGLRDPRYHHHDWDEAEKIKPEGTRRGRLERAAARRIV